MGDDDTGPRASGIEVPQNMTFQRRQWIFERVGWLVMALLVLAAFLGLVGSGPLASASAATPDGVVTVDYNRFVRHRAPNSVDVTVKGSAVGEQVTLTFSRDFWDGLTLESAYPEPESVDVGPDHIAFTFTARQPGQDVRVSFDLLPEDMGRKRAEVGLDGGTPVRITQFIYP